MMKIDDRIILVSAERHCECNHYCDCGSKINISSDWCVEDFFKEALKEDWFVQFLKNNGWMNIDKIENITKKKEMEQKFFYMNESSFFRSQVTDIDLTDEQNILTMIGSLAKKGCILQKVNTKSVLSKEMYKAYLKEKKVIEARSKESQKKKQETKEKKKQKLIEKARKLLEEENLLK